MKILVTGGAGFIGSHLVDRLVEQRHEVVVLDDLSAGDEEFVAPHLSNANFQFHKIDLLQGKEGAGSGGLTDFFEGVEQVWHLAANPEVRVGVENTRVHLEQNVLATYNVLEAMRAKGVRQLVFTSTSTVYGDAEKLPTPEDYPTIPISLYGASKLACEALIASYCHTFEMRAWIYRFANVVGRRSSHGVIYDFIKKLRRRSSPAELEILGDGEQTKSYIYVDDCVEAMFAGAGAGKSVNIFNIGTDDRVSVKRIAEIVCEEMRAFPRPKFKFTGGKRGWKGDVPVMMLDASRLKKMGWRQRWNSEEAVQKAARDLSRVEDL